VLKAGGVAVPEANNVERELAETLCSVGGMKPSQAPGLALVIASYRETLLALFEAQAEACAVEAEKAPPAEASAYCICGDRLRDAIALARGAR
jgi:hypothetical protein